MDGVLLDTEVLYETAINTILRKHGHELSADINYKRKGMHAMDTAKFMIQTYNLPLTIDEYYALLKTQYADTLPLAKLLPGVERLVRHLHCKRIPIAVATSSSDYSYNLKMSRHKDLFSLFHHTVMAGSDKEVKKGKPAPDIFLICARRFPENPRPNNCLVFEDAMNGIQAAVAAGMPCVMVTAKTTPCEYTKNATVVVESLLEFQPEMFGLPPFPTQASLP